MRLLILGGTVFLGRHLVEAALARGHEVTLFNRGQHNPDLYPEVEKLRGDRDGGLDALRGRRWDAVIDPSGYLPRIVGASAALLADAVEHYTFISSISVYPSLPQPGMDESAPLATLPEGAPEAVTGETYGPYKVLCEQAVEAALPRRATHVRAGLIVGRYDPTGRFTYWPHRVARGGDVLAPGRPERPVQFIDGRDLADWCLLATEQRSAGAFNVTGPRTPLPFGDLLDAARDTIGSDARFTWVEESFLLEQGAGPWMELPLWIPESDLSMAGFQQVSINRALATGLSFRPLADTIRDTLAWSREAPDLALPPNAGLRPEREAELLAAWHARA